MGDHQTYHMEDGHHHHMEDGSDHTYHTGSHSEWQMNKKTSLNSLEGGSDHTPSGGNNLHTSASGAVVSNHTHFNDLASSSHSHSLETTPSNGTACSDRQLRDLCTLFPHLSEEQLRGVLVEVGGDSDKAIEALTDSDQLANAPRPVSLSHTL